MEAHVRDRFVFLHPDPDRVERFAATHRGQFGTDLKGYLWHVQARQGHDTTALLDQVRVPTLGMVGEADTVAGSSYSHVESSRYLAEHIPGAQWVVVPDAAHMVFLEQPTAFNQAVENFLAAH